MGARSAAGIIAMKQPSADRQERERDYQAALVRNAERVRRDIRASQDALDRHRRAQLEKQGKK